MSPSCASPNPQGPLHPALRPFPPGWAAARFGLHRTSPPVRDGFGPLRVLRLALSTRSDVSFPVWSRARLAIIHVLIFLNVMSGSANCASSRPRWSYESPDSSSRPESRHRSRGSKTGPYATGTIRSGSSSSTRNCSTESFKLVVSIVTQSHGSSTHHKIR